MADTTEQQPLFSIEKLYLKDASFESPSAPAVFRTAVQPTIEIDINVNTRKVAEALYAVELTLTCTAKTPAAQDREESDQTLFLVEVVQGGLFTLRHIPEQDQGPLLGIECPNILFPYAREVVSSLTANGGFQPLLLNPVNFAAMYRAQQDQPVAAA